MSARILHALRHAPAAHAHMRIVVFGLSITSAWGNGHATLWRGLCRALGGMGHQVTFFERDVPYYAAHRDLTNIPGCAIRLYADWAQVEGAARLALADADVGLVTSYCVDGIAATELVVSSPVGTRVFYDLDTPVTLARLRDGESVPYIGPRLLRDFDLVLSYTGGGALAELRDRLGARWAEPLYGSVDPLLHRPAAPAAEYRADLSYLGTYAADRQVTLERLFIDAARRLPEKRFLIGGAQYPGEFPWTSNIHFVWHVEPSRHAAFYCSSPLTMNVTRGAMAEMGWCPSGRLFEAAACGVPIVSDQWDGLGDFFTPGEEILVAATTSDVVQALAATPAELARIARRARERAFDEHTATHRARRMVALLERQARAHGRASASAGSPTAAREVV